MTGLNADPVTIVYDDYATIDEQDCWYVGSAVRPQIRQIKPVLGKTRTIGLAMGSTCRSGGASLAPRPRITAR
jgi:hypothetical protein